MNASARTPGPIEVKAVNGRPTDTEAHCFLVAADGRDLMIGDFTRSEADAEFLALAWNTHDDLVAALRASLQLVRLRGDSKLNAQVSAALAKAAA